MIIVRTILWCLCIFWALLAGISALDSANWMMINMPMLRGRLLKNICIPGSHNSGMYKLNGGTAFAKSCNILNQSQNIRKQLELGVRFFDIRPVISGGKFKTGHYTKLAGGVWQGGNGEFIKSIIDDINDFTRNHNELIIINLSHSLNTDEVMTYRQLSQGEWNRLFKMLDRTDNLFYGLKNAYLPGHTLGNLTDFGGRSAVIYIINEKGVRLDNRLGNGYFYSKNIQIFDQYSETDVMLTMFNDQMNKMKRRSASNYFLLSWTLTQNSLDATICPFGKSLSHLAYEANKNLWRILPEVSYSAFPNILLVDFVENTDVIEVVMDINDVLHYKQ